jgi:6-phosphogluconolactonase
MAASAKLACSLLGTLSVALFFSAPSARAADAAPTKLWVYVGTYTQGTKSKGIYRYDLDLATGKLSGETAAGEAVNPSFLAIAPNHRFLYAVDEIADFKGAKAGAVTAFAIDPHTGNLTRLNQQTSGGAGPSHHNVENTGKKVLVAN